MTGIFILGLIIFIALAVGLFLLIGGPKHLGSWRHFGQHYLGSSLSPYAFDYRYGVFPGTGFYGQVPVQSGNLDLTMEKKEDAVESYKQQIVFEEDHRLYLNNIASALIIILAFSIFFLLIGSFAYYYYSNLIVEPVNSQKLLYGVLILIPFGFLMISLVFAARAFKLNYPVLLGPGFDKTFVQFGADTSVLAYHKDDESKIEFQLRKLIEQFNFIVEINQRKKSSLTYAKMIFLFAFISALPLIFITVGNYFNLVF
jgi:hypothetical protein